MTPLWRPDPSSAGRTRPGEFMQHVNDRYSLALSSYGELYDWSIHNPGDFWAEVWSFCEVRGTRGSRQIVDAERMPGARFFPDATLNFADNLLRRDDDGDAIVFQGEDKASSRLSWRQLNRQVAQLARALQAQGVGPGDRVAGFMPNLPETVVAMLATSALGATWASCSPDFGVQGVLDRFGQIEPDVLFACDGYVYGGKSFDTLDKVAAIAHALPGLRRVVVVPYLAGIAQEEPTTGEVPHAQLLADVVADYPDTKFDFEPFEFAQPLYILFSSGTTGAPKCIVHTAGGTLLQHLKEHQLHCDVRQDDRLFYFTTCTWMMWNWLASGLASGATLLLYDGSPAHPDYNVLFDFADAQRMTHFGTSARFIDSLAKEGVHPARSHRLGELRMLLSTGSPLAPESFDFVYQHIKHDVCLASIAGGTDIVSCFVLGSPLLPVYRGEIACRGLGMAVEVWDEQGHAVVGEKGELVCTAPFPSMPAGFWRDPGHSRYHDAYFARFDNVWAHGDFAELTPRGGMIIYGRSDATLNPGGVRIGTAEIYRQVNAMDEIVDSVVIGQGFDNDVRVILFAVLREGETLDDALCERIRRQIRQGASPRHVPAKIIQVADIPRTKSGKITELAVRDVVEGRPVKNASALANPEALALFANLPELADSAG